MTGVLNESISDLFALQYLVLGGGQIGGAIPSSIGKLKNVTNFALFEHEFEGPIPASVGNMTNLEMFYGFKNRLNGSVPEFTNCEALSLAVLNTNNLSGELPSFASNPNLRTLELKGNNLTGRILPFTSNSKLQILNLANNQFSRNLPHFNSNPNLQTLHLYNNSLLGEIPDFSSNRNLQQLYLRNNNLNGSVPKFSSQFNLTELDVSKNNLSGPLPSFTSNPNLQELYVFGNSLSGNLFHDFSATPHLQYLLAHNNDFSGTLSPTLFDLKNITSVILSGNPNLKGTLPTTLSTPSLTNLVIEGCSFTGPLPTTITSPLSLFYLAGNSFSSSIPPLPPTIVDVSLAYNQITGSIPPSFFSHTPKLKTFDVRHNKIGGSMPTSLSNLTDLADLKLDLNDFSGDIPSAITTWPIFAANDTNTTVLFGNLWSCPVPDSVREHSNEDPNHAYSCGGSEFVTPAILAAAAGAFFVVAASFTKKCESVLSLIGTYTRGREEVLSDASNIVNVGHACYKLVFAILLASIGLSTTYWNADSNFETQPTFLKLSVSLKTASNGFILPQLTVSTLLLLYFINWGWNLRFEGHDNINVHIEETAKEKKKRRSWRGSLKLFGIFAYTIILVVAFDFVYVFFVTTNPTINQSSKVLANTALSQFKSTLLNERWAAKASMKLINPKKRFNYLVFTMSVVMLLNALVVPSILILLLDERCFKYLLVQQEPHEANVPITYCKYTDATGAFTCPDTNKPNNGYGTDIYSTTFNYPWSLSDQCGSALIQAYSPVVILELLTSGFLQPALWWLCIDGGNSHEVKWAVLAIGVFVSELLPQIVSLVADDIDSRGVLGVVSVGVFAFVFIVGWGVTRFRGAVGCVVEEESTWFYLPSVDYLLEFFDYNVDEDRVFGRKNYTWPLLEWGCEVLMEKVGVIMDHLGFAKGNFDGGLKSVIDDFRLTEETFDEEKISKIEETETKKTVKYGRELPYTYANLVKNIALIFTFGLASSITAWIGCIGILFRWLALSFLAERHENKTGGKYERTDAQGIPLRSIVLVVVCNIGFFGTAATLARIFMDTFAADGGVWTPVFLVFMVLALWSQLMVLPYGGWLKALKVPIKSTATKPVENGGENNVKAEAISSPMQNNAAGGSGIRVEGKEVAMIEIKLQD
ncbi:hypothetical protein TrLO_g12324 [Triparma laevis f. longispina]|uniref:Uncharacterized protein n=1 Tax=Triparma laevis f. longispina TaxID=1714387 RepID=A0A9W7FMM6_9STRA|nr:hypothetical protein TrLO_g12324 [Triparma laevis f. longispina]